MSPVERDSEVYGLTSTYALLLLNSTYDVAIKEIFRKTFGKALSLQNNIQKYIGEMIDRKILNRYMTNIKHQQVKDTFALEIDVRDAELQTSISVINELISTRNKIAHGLETSSKGHNDLEISLRSVIYYLNWYCDELLKRFIEES
nr:MAE_28990/MAE_18760 family HEPN-like nuclease [Psychrobacillus sp. MER TA 171]